MYFQKQLQDYQAWVNNYLKRRPGVQPIVDMRTGLQDGIALVNLVEIVGEYQVAEGWAGKISFLFFSNFSQCRDSICRQIPFLTKSTERQPTKGHFIPHK